MFTEKSLDAVFDEIDLEIVCDTLNIESQGEVASYTCPFCGEESFVLDSCSKAKRYYCFDCEAKGDALDLIKNGWDRSLEDSVKFLSILFNVKLEETEKKESLIKKNSPSYIIPLVLDIMKNEKLTSIDKLACCQFVELLNHLNKD